MRYFVIRLFGLLIIVNSICLCYLRYHADWQTQRVNGLIRSVDQIYLIALTDNIDASWMAI